MEPRNYYHPCWTLSGVTLTLSTSHFFNFNCKNIYIYIYIYIYLSVDRLVLNLVVTDGIVYAFVASTSSQLPCSVGVKCSDKEVN
jgi:hypothetical protein